MSFSQSVDEDDQRVSVKPMIVINPLYSRSCFSNYYHSGKCGGEWCSNGCWKYYCNICNRGCNSQYSSCCKRNKEFDNYFDTSRRFFTQPKYKFKKKFTT